MLGNESGEKLGESGMLEDGSMLEDNSMLEDSSIIDTSALEDSSLMEDSSINNSTVNTGEHADVSKNIAECTGTRCALFYVSAQNENLSFIP